MKTIIICLFISSSLLAQVVTAPAPLKPGNRWIYNSYLAGDYSRSYPFQFEVTDSIKVIDGVPFYAVRGGGFMGLVNNEFFARYDETISDSLYTYFKINPQKGDAWEQYWKGGVILYNSIIDTFTAKVFNKYTLVYVIDRKDSSLIIGSREYWTKEYGMIDGLYEQEEDILKGCVIDGILYGDTTVTGIEDIKGLPDKFVLYQNFPNPFNPTTSIKYFLSESGMVKLVIYNVLGQTVKTLVNKYQNSGSYSINANLSNYSSGVYIYRLDFAGEKGEQFSSVKKMILLK